MIRASCPFCDRELSAPDKMAGKEVTCPHCKSAVRLPSRPAAVRPDPVVILPEPDYAPPIPVSTPRRLRRRYSEGTGFICPFCGTDLPPLEKSTITPAGAYIMIVCLITVCLASFFWIGFFFRHEWRVCSQCGIKLG
jgi:hypothetical protein